MEIYLDNSATTKCLDCVKDLVVQTMIWDYGNPASLHRKGMEAESYIRQSKERISAALKCKEKEIVFTSGGTESNNLAIIGTAMANRRAGGHVITTQIEHASVRRPFEYLEEQGFRVTYLPVNEYGLVNLDALRDAVCEETILVSVMHVNNEIGTIQPIEEISHIVRKKNDRTYIHVDSIQGFGKLKILPKRMGIDLLSISGHKIHGPKGTGILYIRENAKVKPLMLGGGQQKDMRSGTENVPGAAGIGLAVSEAYAHLEENAEHMYGLRKYFMERLCVLEGVSINGYDDERNAPHIVSANFEGVRSEVLLHSLEEHEIYVSSGSACSSNKKTASATMEAIGRHGEQAEGTIRFSFSKDTTREQLDICLEQLEKLLPMLRRYRRY